MADHTFLFRHVIELDTLIIDELVQALVAVRDAVGIEESHNSLERVASSLDMANDAMQVRNKLLK